MSSRERTKTEQEFYDHHVAKAKSGHISGVSKSLSVWTSVKDKWPKILDRCVFYDPFSDFISEGRFTGKGFLVDGIEYKGTHWVDIEKPSRQDVVETINWLKSSVG